MLGETTTTVTGGGKIDPWARWHRVDFDPQWWIKYDACPTSEAQ